MGSPPLQLRPTPGRDLSALYGDVFPPQLFQSSFPSTHSCSLTQLPVPQQPLLGGPHNFSHSLAPPLRPRCPPPPAAPRLLPLPSALTSRPEKPLRAAGGRQSGPAPAGAARGDGYPRTLPPRSAAGPPRRTPAAGAHYLAACLPPPIAPPHARRLSIPQVPAEAHCAGADLTGRIWPFPALPSRPRTRTAPNPSARGH